MKKKYILPITYKCNWNCFYCIVDTHNNYIRHDDVLEKINNIKSNSIVHFEGGEPGMVPLEYIKEYILKLKEKNCEILLNTNGLFLEKYPELIHHFSDILYHCIEDISSREDIIFYKVNYKITYMLLVDDSTIVDLEYYILKYPTIKFFVSSMLGYNNLSYKNALLIIKTHKNKLHKDSVMYLLGDINDK